MEQFLFFNDFTMILIIFLVTSWIPLSTSDSKFSQVPIRMFRREFIGETSGCDRACQKECINVHNKYRANHGAKPLVFDQKLANEAQALIDKGVFKHSDWVKLKKKGAAFAWGSLFPTFTAVIKSWHDEGFYYDYQKGAPKKPTQIVDHFEQIMWKGTRKIGCARGGFYGEPWYVAHYDQAPDISKDSAIDNIQKPMMDESNWFKDSSPYTDELQNAETV
ncbi:Golgi-associated plant pathogenesis-related protein 1-like isoform X1 [Acropora millepora]|uniref:Golgi-associated plant pathogenesis-related protein 1-like isoform X1 n=2 Tax=Acropora millepora TaxID=45264 RepID=UPI001CF50B20|nr:Golgi-associated plant pathogenesis-related protein 1-like isoform X1 [Acropora millepora]